MSTDHVRYAINGAIAEITLNRPEKLNSITGNMVEALHLCMDRAESDPAVRAILLRAEGKSFSAGFDLGEMDSNPSRPAMRAVLQADYDIIMRFWHSPKPTISAIQGYALGGGFELAMACDASIASEDACFGEPEPKFGSGIVALLLPWLTGPKQAKEMLLFGNDRIDALRALSWGLVNAVVPRGLLDDEARALARNATLLDASAVRLTKQAINGSYQAMGMEGALRQALALDLEIELSQDEESVTFRRILAEQGVKPAIAWREARFTPQQAHKEPSMTISALVVRKDGDTVSQAIETIDESQLPEGDVTVDIEYSTINYKDGLCLTGQGGLVRNYPHVPGIDFAGTVVTSQHPRFKTGDKVVLTGWRVGEVRWGGYATRTRISGDWLVPLPADLTTRQSMAIGTAGLTAMLAIDALERHGLTPADGDILVTGASGGVGSVAVALLHALGYQVAAVTGRPENSDYLRDLGATTVVDRAELAEVTKRPLESENWAGCVDAVGGAMLARTLGQMKYGASVAAVGLAGGASLPATVIPFLLRGVNLLGIDSVMQPIPAREAAWQRLAKHLPRDLLEKTTREVPLAEVAALGPQILRGALTGRTVVAVQG